MLRMLTPRASVLACSYSTDHAQNKLCWRHLGGGAPPLSATELRRRGADRARGHRQQDDRRDAHVPRRAAADLSNEERHLAGWDGGAALQSSREQRRPTDV